MQRMKPFRKRNPLPIGAASLAIILLLVLASLNIRDLPLIGQGATYTARFSEAAGVQPDDDVRIAGIRVGTVSDLTLDGNDVVISFKAPDAWIGNRTSASIEIKTVLGQKYIALDPAGDAPLDPDVAIPRQRTRAPFDVIQAFSQLTTTVEDLNTGQLAQSLGVLSQTLDSSSEPIRGALDGLSRLSRTISSRDEQLARLLANTRATTQVLADRDAEVERLINDGNLLLSELRARKAAIDALLNGTIALSQQLRGLVADNEATLGPTLAQLDGVLSTLQANSANLENGLRLLAPFIRVFGNVVGNGRWFDAYVCNLDPPGDGACDPGSSADPTQLLGVDPTLLLQILQNALAQLGLPNLTATGLNSANPQQVVAAVAGLSPADLARLQTILGTGTANGLLTADQLRILFPPNGAVPNIGALQAALTPQTGAILPGTGGVLPGGGGGAGTGGTAPGTAPGTSPGTTTPGETAPTGGTAAGGGN